MALHCLCVYIRLTLLTWRVETYSSCVMPHGHTIIILSFECAGYREDRFPGPVKPDRYPKSLRFGPEISDRGSPHIKMTSTESPRWPVSPNLRLGPSFRARARSGGATGLGGRAKRVARPVIFFSHLISDACMDEKYGRTREIFDRSPP